MEALKKMKELFAQLKKMDPAMAEALTRIRTGKSTPEDARIISRGLYTDTMVPKMGNKLAYTEHLQRHANDGYHVHADLNDFGIVNKKYFEPEGDKALKRFGGLASEVSRQFGGKAFRNGGDEFKFWFHRPEAAHGFARELRSRLEKEPKIRGTHNLAASIGIGYNRDHAEQALTNAKSTLGRPGPNGGRRINFHKEGEAPTVIHSMTHEAPPDGWKPGVGKPEAPKPSTPNLAPKGMSFHNPLAKNAVPQLPIAPTFSEVHPTHFEQHISKHPDQANLTQDREYSDKRTFLSHDKKAGYAVSKDGEMSYVFSMQPGHGGHAVHSAIKNGANWLSAFDGHLPKYYTKFGFKETRREPNWTPGAPDVVYMGLGKAEPALGRNIEAPGTPVDHPAVSGGHVGMLTAEDPHHPVSTPGGNAALEMELRAKGVKYEKVKGKYSKPENSFLLHNPSLDMMRDLGKRYGQESVLYSNGGKHQLVFTNGENEGMYHPGEGHVQHPAEPDDFYTTATHNGQPLHFTYNVDWGQMHPLGQMKP